MAAQATVRFVMFVDLILDEPNRNAWPKKIIMKIYLYYNPNQKFGPGKVAENLVKGLQLVLKEGRDNIKIVDNPREADVFGCLQRPSNEVVESLPMDRSVFGPNIFVLPTEEKAICSKFNRFIVPSLWVKNKYLAFQGMRGKDISVWPVGIDAEAWKPNPNIEKDLDCFVYYKNRDKLGLDKIEAALQKRALEYEIIEYGYYQEDQLLSLCNRSKFAILFTNTESQGIANMNIQSMDVPCFVFDKALWTYERDSSFTAAATSVPYFDDKFCGYVFDEEPIRSSFRQEKFDFFLSNLKTYSPRDYILKNHTLKQGAENYLNILSKES
jgi:hypothetical protein